MSQKKIGEAIQHVKVGDAFWEVDFGECDVAEMTIDIHSDEGDSDAESGNFGQRVSKIGYKHQ